VFVARSVKGVLREGAIAAALTFLGSWRSTLVVMISIPLSILASLVVLYFRGETLNTMSSAVSRWRSEFWSTIHRNDR
jgi:multidrug efflux pump subunit AcrB